MDDATLVSVLSTSRKLLNTAPDRLNPPEACFSALNEPKVIKYDSELRITAIQKFQCSQRAESY